MPIFSMRVVALHLASATDSRSTLVFEFYVVFLCVGGRLVFFVVGLISHFQCRIGPLPWLLI